MVNTEKKAYKGTWSSAILSIIVLCILLIPFYTANHIQKSRNGEGKYDFKETICFDIDGQEDFNDDPDWSEDCGAGALGYDYDNGISGFSLNYMEFVETPLEGTVDGYGIGDVETCSFGEVDFSIIIIFLTITKDDIIGNDVTRIDIFLAVSGTTNSYVFELILGGGGELALGEIKVNELTEITFTVEDIMEIYTFDEGEPLLLAFIPTEEDEFIQPESAVIFDMQMYCIEEMDTLSIWWLGIAMSGAGMFMIFCSVLMLPTMDFSGILKKRVKGGE